MQQQQQLLPRPWTARLGLALLWLAALSVVGLMVLVGVFFIATIEWAATQPLALASMALLVLATLAVLTALVFATRRHAWARWVAAVAGMVIGGLGLVAITITRSPAPETVGISLVALVGGVLLALPSSRPWFDRAAPGQRERIPARR